MRFLQAENGRTRMKTGVVIWACLWVALFVLIIHPVSSTVTRLALVLVTAAIICGIFLFLRRSIVARIALLLIVLLASALVFLPGRDYDRAGLRSAYVYALKSYEGTRYVWGGENGRGIDCSGLVRRAWVDANVREGLATVNPRLVREGLRVWWSDCGARDLGAGYQGKTRVVGSGECINSLDSSFLLPGDLAVTADGVHVLAYIGDGVWTEANPEQKRVISESYPQLENYWFTIPVKIVRWSEFE
ncbi:MAG TPA: NlpC/P60 family protein [Blastocatellia bacterium]|nr:NlpC/P60 family protein [Blastocatellia bacterium]